MSNQEKYNEDQNHEHRNHAERNHEERNEEKKDVAPQPEPAPVAESCAVEIGEVKVETAAEPASAEPVVKREEPALVVVLVPVRAAYEHPLAIRVTHWVNAVSLFVMVTSGLRIFRAFPSFGPKIPEKVLLDIPKSLTLGGWLAGPLQWHFTFMWFFAARGVLYVAYQIISGHYRTMLFTPRDIPGASAVPGPTHV